jgi:CMP-N-acetylneuraminic acid synthetase
MSSPKISVIVTAHNYAEYLEKCLDSAIKQTHDNYEIVVVDDGSTDDTPEIIREYSYEQPDLFTSVRLSGEGLPTAANAGIEAAEGEYIIRLDADDYFDENILTVLGSYLDSNPDIELVYPDYYTVNDDEEILNHVRLPKVGQEVKLLNRSPLAAGAMYRKSAWEQLGGYKESLSYQEDYDFWIRFINKFDVHNINLPLMYYRQHGDSMSTNLSGRLNARRSLKGDFVENTLGDQLPAQEVLAVIPARKEQRVQAPDFIDDSLNNQPLALYEVGGQTLLEHTIEAGRDARRVDRVIVSTESEAIAEVARGAGVEVPELRPESLSESDVQLSDVVNDLLDRLKSKESYCPEIVTILPYISPLRKSEHVDEAIETMHIFSIDSVLSVNENQNFLWQPGKFGLEPLYEKRLLREEKEGLYQENGGIYVVERDVIRNRDEIVGEHVGHILMQPHTSISINSWMDLKLCEKIFEVSNENGKDVTEVIDKND